MSHAQPQTGADIEPTITFGGEVFVPLPSGALFWPGMDALLVADLHFEKMSSFAKRGQLLPPYDTAMTINWLERDIGSTGAKKVFALGDSFHRDEGTSTLREADRLHLHRLVGDRDWVWLSGNHDPSPHALGGSCCSEIAIAGCVMRHEPSRGQAGLISGHLHPAARVSLNGKSARRSCFVWDENLMILPAYGASTGSLNILSPAFRGLFDHGEIQVVMTGRDRVYPVGFNRLVLG